MPRSKNKKDHRKRVSARNEKIEQIKKSQRKKHQELLMKLIEQEKQKGLYDNINSVPSVLQKDLDLPEFGPSI